MKKMTGCFERRKLNLIPGGMGQSFEVGNNIQIGNDPSTYPNSSVQYSQLFRGKPDIYTVVNDKQEFVAKVICGMGGVDTLLNESRILQVLWFPWPRVSPRLISYLQECKGAYYFIFEKFSDEKWASLSLIVKKGPITNPEHMLQLQSSVYFAIHWLHLCGVVHGDIKDDHIFIRKIGPYEYDFSDIRIIDFGLGSIYRSARWHGASIGFASAYLWDRIKNRKLTYRDSLCQDWYGANATLYYAFTGECFPTTTPSYATLMAPQNEIKLSSYFTSIADALKNRHRANSQSGILHNIIEHLSQPNVTYIPSLPESLFKTLGQRINKNRLQLFLGLLVIGVSSVLLPVQLVLGLILLLSLTIRLMWRSWPLVMQTHDSLEPEETVTTLGYIVSFALLVFSMLLSFVASSVNDMGFIVGIPSVAGLLGLLLIYLRRSSPETLMLWLFASVGAVLSPIFSSLILLLLGWLVNIKIKRLGLFAIFTIFCHVIFAQMISIGRKTPLLSAWIMAENLFWIVEFLGWSLVLIITFFVSNWIWHKEKEQLDFQKNWVIFSSLIAWIIPYFPALLFGLMPNINFTIVISLGLSLIFMLLGMSIVISRYHLDEYAAD